MGSFYSLFLLAVGRNKTTQACPERIEGRSAWWRFRHIRVLDAGNAYSRLRSKSLIPAYADSDIQPPIVPTLRRHCPQLSIVI